MMVSIFYMRNSIPKSLNSLFEQNTFLNNFQDKSLSLSQLHLIIMQLLPEQLHAHCQVANYRQGVLIIEVSSASWLTRLRYEQETLMSLLRQQHLTGLSSIQYKITPSIGEQKHTLHSSRPVYHNQKISPQSAIALLSLAEKASPRLKESLIKLAKNTTKLDNNK